MEDNRKSLIFAILAIVAWATIPTAFKIGLETLPVLSMLTVASVSSTLVLLVIIALSGKLSITFRFRKGDIARSVVLGLINPVLYYLILLKAYQLLPAQVAQPLNMIWPIILVFLSVPLLGHKVSRKSIVSLFISFAGVYVIASQGNLLHPGKSDPLGVFLATCSSVFWAFYFILNVRDKRDPAVKLFLNFLVASAVLVPLWLAIGDHSMFRDTKGLITSVYIGIFEMGLTFWLWLTAMSYAKSTALISNLVYLAPFLSLIFISIFLVEIIYITTPIGLIFIIAGIFLQNRRTISRT